MITEVDKIVEVLIKRIKKDGPIRLLNLPRVFVEEDLDKSVYGSMGPKKWITNHIKELEIEGSNGYETLQLSAQNKKAEISKIIEEQIRKENGKILLSTVTNHLSSHGINYKDYSDGKKLSVWIISEFPEFQISDDSLYLFLSGNESSLEEMLSSDKEKMDAGIAEVQQMHALAYMNQWKTDNISDLKKYNEELTADYAKETVAHNLACAILGMPNRLIVVPGEENEFAAFDTGLKTKSEKIIYSIMVPNPNYLDGKNQKWAKIAFACEDDDSEYGEWIRNNISRSSNEKISVFDLEEKLQNADQIMKNLIPSMQEYLDALNKNVFPQKEIANQIQTFENCISEVKGLYEKIWEEAYPEDMSIEQSLEKIGGEKIVVEQINKIVDEFCEIADKVEKIFYEVMKFEPLEKSTPQLDKEKICSLYTDTSGEMDFSVFLNILKQYKELRLIMSASSGDFEKVVSGLRVLSEHFEEMNRNQVMAFRLIGMDKEHWEFLLEIEQLEQQIQDVTLMVSEPKEQEEKREFTIPELFEECLTNPKDGIQLSLLAASIYPEDSAVRMLISGEIDSLIEYLENNKDDALFSEDTIQKLKTESLSRELTYSSTAHRLETIFGDYQQLAEKYYILGMGLETEKCVSALLRIYRETGRMDDFRRVFDQWCEFSTVELENQLFYVKIAAQENPAEALRLGKENCYLLHNAGYLQTMLELGEEILTSQVAADFEAALNRAKVEPENDLEIAITEGNREKIEACLSEDAVLLGYGYTEEEILQIKNKMTKEESLVSDDDYEMGDLIYRFQKNKHGLAERYMWDGIAKKRNTLGARLMMLLWQEARWEECCALYENFEKLYSENNICKMMYILAKIKADSKKAEQHILSHLQDVLQMFAVNYDQIKPTVEATAQDENTENKEFYVMLLQIGELMKDSLLQSVVLMNRTLREYATGTAQEGVDLTEDQIRSFSEAYKTNTYPRGVDAISTSERTFQFLGQYKNAAELFARIAIPEENAILQLWRIYKTINDEVQMFQLLEEYSFLKDMNKEWFLNKLFEREEYVSYIKNCPKENITWEEEMQLFIAELKVDPQSVPELPSSGEDLSEEDEAKWYGIWGKRLISSMHQADRIKDISRIFNNNFTSWIKYLEPEVIREIITGEGSLKEEELLQISSQALENDNTDIAVYLFNNLQVGDLQEMSERLYEQSRQEIAELSNDERYASLRKLQILYGENDSGISSELSLIQLRQLIEENTEYSASVSEVMRSIIEKMKADEESVEELLEVFRNTPYCLDKNIYTSILACTEGEKSKEKVLLFFHEIGKNHADILTQDYLSFLCRLYLSVLKNNAEFEEIVSEAKTICKNYVEKDKSTEGILCLCYLEDISGNKAYAEYLLRILADQPSDTIDEEIQEVIGRLLKKTWEAHVPSYFELFKNYLTEASVEEIQEYVAYANQVTDFSDEQIWNEIDSGEIDEDRMLSENDSNIILKQLYASPKKPEIWKACEKLTLQDNPQCYAKVLYISSIFNPLSWPKCAEYCEKYELSDMLLEVLNKWANNPNSNERDSLRKYLEERLVKQENYFEKWYDNELLLELVKTICKKVPNSEYEYHNTLRAVQLITVRSNLPEALEFYLNQFKSSLLGPRINLAVVLAADLLLHGRIKEGKDILSQLSNVLGTMNYQDLVQEMNALSEEELILWLENLENRIMLQLILPDGNRPSLEQIRTIAIKGIRNNQVKETAKTFLQLLQMFPNDYGIYNALFNLCCMKYEGYIPDMHTCVRGLISNEPISAAASFYRRKVKQYAYLLAILDAVVISKGLTREITKYDFSKDTGDFIRRATAGRKHITYNDVMSVNNIRAEVLKTFENRTKEEEELLTEAYLCCITGNWKDFLVKAWREEIDIQYELDCTKKIMDEDFGFARSVMRALAEVEKEERINLLQWLKNRIQIEKAFRNQTMRQRQLAFVNDFYQEGFFEQLCSQIEIEPFEQILQNPFEDYSYASIWKEDYLLPAVSKNSENLLALTWLLGGLICHNGFQSELSNQAEVLFESGKDHQASSVYYVMFRLIQRFGLIHTYYQDRNTYNTVRIMSKEQYEARYRITSLFSGNEEMIRKVGGSDFHVWSCINLVLSLMYSKKRADEVLRLVSYLNNENAQLSRAILDAFNPNIDETSKMELIDTLQDDVAKFHFCYVVKYPYNPYGKEPKTESYALKSKEAKEEFNRVYINLVKQLTAQGETCLSGYRPVHPLLILEKGPNPKAFDQKDPRKWQIAEDAQEKEAEEKSKTPFFAENLDGVNANEEIEELINEHKKLPNLSDNIAQKLSISKKIYQHFLSITCPQNELIDAMLLYGNDYYLAALAQKDTKKAGDTLLELAGLMKQGIADGYGSEETKKTLPNGLFGMLTSFETLRELVNSYGENKSCYIYMREVLSDPLLTACIRQVYMALENIRSCYSSMFMNNPEVLREELSKNYRQLENIETNRWMEVKNRVQKLITDEINELDRRPILHVEVLNSGKQRTYGSLFGQVYNVGQIPAENVILQANYGDNSTSSQYVLDRLSAGAKAVFEVDYSCAPQTEQMEYFLNVTFSYEGKTYSTLGEKGLLEFAEIEEPTYPSGILAGDPNGIIFTSDPDTGEVFSPEFIGRKKETAQMRALVEGNDFASYKSALVYGVRRTGKTSILNYLSTYINANKPNVICVKTDCQKAIGNISVQTIFIDRVLEIIELEKPEIKALEEWTELKNKWYSEYFCVDDKLDKLDMFYLELGKVIGDKGVYLIIDEIDRLFEKIEERNSPTLTLDSLFGTLSALLNSEECRKVVHMVICGSNWLIRYNLKGEMKNQLFQRFGRQVIEIGKLPENDAKEVICSPYQGYPQLNITKETLDWIWNYTGGLVWHTKLLGEEAIARAKDDYRNTVYPSDVQQSLPTILSTQWCKQFYEGCETGAENQVVEAMQSLAYKKDGYIHINRICEILKWSSYDVEKILLILKELKVVSQHKVDRQLYRFEQDIYRRYFRTQPSIYERIPEEPDVFRRKRSAETGDGFDKKTIGDTTANPQDNKGDEDKTDIKPVTETTVYMQAPASDNSIDDEDMDF